MPRSIQRVYSRYTLEAIKLFAEMIRFERKNQKMTESELAERAGISRSMLQRIEKADPKCELGVVFEVAALLGIPLFDATADVNRLIAYRRQTEDKLSLMPQRIRKPAKETFDDF
ncbi:helix-turn-helix transcriptional regulator [Erwinia sp. S43]|uniref:helix-turn-helix domain-containing protein n=1 Tax=unclassified Erwinia TaxID=2622719 RepID=UPI000F48D33A|nr:MULTISPECIES: helix-turn-helix transcriptional regulator [unclassified Erwinia]MBK0000811.1 helix-turn-helix transcriptional regulator [Erwinia sp. S38]MBK0031209.1 helix-turn-helix transcriptional regulator [Erwinia sp. S43]ROR09927.1 helix-turn-helix protein [Erwinia sp. JUb26]